MSVVVGIFDQCITSILSQLGHDLVIISLESHFDVWDIEALTFQLAKSKNSATYI